MASVLDFVSVNVDHDVVDLQITRSSEEFFVLATKAQVKALATLDEIISSALHNQIKVRVNGVICSPKAILRHLDVLVSCHDLVKMRNMLTFI